MTTTMTVEQMAAALREAGYTVTKRSTTRKATVLKGKRHEECVDHQAVDGYRSKVCILEDQDAGEVIAFAEEIRSIATSAGDVLTIARLRDAAAAEQAVAA